MSILLLTCGIAIVAVGTWRGYANARAALAPIAHEGEPTRAAVDAGRPLLERTRIRNALKATGLAFGWLVLAMYGLFMIAAAETAA